MNEPLVSQHARGLINPVIFETTSRGERGWDVFSRLLKDRIIFLGTPIDDDVANLIIGQMLFLDTEDPKKEIWMYINSPGGVVTAGMAIYDTMRFIRPPVYTLCVGQAASMGALLLTAGEPGHRFSLPSSTIMIHQPLGGARGQASDIEIQAREIRRHKDRLNRIIADSTGQDIKQVEQDTDRDNYLDPEQAKAYGKKGLIDGIMEKRRM